MKSNLFLTVALCLLLFSCNKKSENPNCLAVINPPKLKFNIISQESQKDLFFAESAAYQISDLKIYKYSDTKHEQPLKIEVQVEGESGKKNFSINLDGALTNGSLEFNIGSSIKHKLDYSASIIKTPCPEYKINEIKFNQTVVTTNTGIYMLMN
ncbi:hypothetical protein ACUN24_19210 [Pedobacter sp. WC2501]|uniref:hypothetical protein n=1 Tax=Pedobacter sp. WC2501 TaxID=3461400 RepID=UPI004046077A